jgi:hypothetical protein
MKKILSVPLTAFIVLILITHLFGCAGWNQARVEQKYGPPAKKEIVDDKTIYHYYSSGLRGGCVDLTFDKDGKLINKKEYYDERCKSQQIDSWLTISGGEPPKIDVTGKWHDALASGFFGWGEGYLRQEQNKVSGAIGAYDIKGVVSGKIVYLIFLYHGTVYYAARLEMSQDVLIGNYFKGNDREQTEGYSMSLEKTVGAAK